MIPALFSIISVGALLLLAFLLKLAEVSVGAVSDSELIPLIQSGNKKAKRVASLSEDKLPFVSSLRTAISTVEFLAFGIVSYSCVDDIATPLARLGLPLWLGMLIGATAVTLAFVLVTATLIAIIARHIAIKHSLRISLALSGFAFVLSSIFIPISALISAIAVGALRLMGIDRHEQENDASEEAIKLLVDEGSEKGEIDPEEKEFIENVFAFDDLTADDAATHRTGITVLWTDETDEEWEKTILESHHTYFPVCDEKIDNVVGVLNSKEYFRTRDRSRESVMKRAVRAPFFIPVSMKTNAILKMMKQKREYFAVVIDEYGGLSGIVTVTDLLECIVGDIYEDEDAPRIPEIERLDSKSWKILGQAPLEDAAEALGVTLEGDFDTFAGYVLTLLGSIPDDGTVATVENELMTVRITEIQNRRIHKTMVKLKDSIDPDAAEERIRGNRQ